MNNMFWPELEVYFFNDKGEKVHGRIFRCIPAEGRYEVVEDGKRNWEGILVSKHQLMELNPDYETLQAQRPTTDNDLSAAPPDVTVPSPNRVNQPMRLERYDPEPEPVVAKIVPEPEKPVKTTTKRKTVKK